MKKIGLLLAFLAVFLIGKQGMEQAVETVNELSDEEHPEIALTFDDGPHEVYTGQLLDGLKERGVQVTFFLIGQNIEGKEDVVKRMKAEGHLIGNHTYHHVNLKEISEKKAEEEVQMTCNKIYDTAGICTSFVRPPFGEWKKNLDFDITMIPVSWNVDSLDWTTENVDKTVKRVVKDVEEDDIILMHDIYDATADAAVVLIPELTARGYQLVTVSELAAARGGMSAGHKYSQFR